MREMKFRAWDDIDEELCGPFTVKDINNEGSWIAEGTTILELFTGLLDSEGKEIYVGDIFKWMSLEFPITVDDYHGLRFMFGKDQLNRAIATEGRVIGNIHENPELVKP